jgi:hypothetical protein
MGSPAAFSNKCARNLMHASHQVVNGFSDFRNLALKSESGQDAKAIRQPSMEDARVCNAGKCQ